MIQRELWTWNLHVVLHLPMRRSVSGYICALTSKRIDVKAFLQFANGCNILLLISCWGFKVRLEHLSTQTPIGRTRSHSLKLLKPFIDKMILMAIRRVRPWYRDRITLESRMWNLHLALIHFAHVWICAWAVQLKLQETHSVTRSLFANRCYSHLLTDCFFKRGWVFGF